MAASPLAPEVTVWTDARRAGRVARLLELMGASVRTIGVGGDRSTELSDLARRLEAPYEDDFRKLLVERPATFVLLATAEGVSRDDLALALRQGSTVLAVEPVDDDLTEHPFVRARGTGGGRSSGDGAEAAAHAHAGVIVSVPAFLRSPGWTAAADPLEVIGQPRLLSFTSLGPSDDASLFARLHDACQVVVRLAGVPDSLDASLVGPLAEVPESPRALTGYMAVHARLPQRGAVVLQISDRVGVAGRELRLVADRGQVQATDGRFRMLDGQGAVLDEGGSDAPTGDAVELIAAQWRRMLDRPAAVAAQPVPDESQVLACCLAAHLSARTGQPESPQKLLALQRHA